MHSLILVCILLKIKLIGLSINTLITYSKFFGWKIGFDKSIALSISPYTVLILLHKGGLYNETTNNVVYKILCNNCDFSYVGQTKRQLKTRINEHVKNIKAE